MVDKKKTKIVSVLIMAIAWKNLTMSKAAKRGRKFQKGQEKESKKHDFTSCPIFFRSKLTFMFLYFPEIFKQKISTRYFNLNFIL